MTDENRRILIDAGMDVDTALNRFMNNDAMLEKFLQKFRQDKSFQQIKDAIEEGNVENAFRAAHTLKGVAGNFSFDRLWKAASDQTEEFRAGKFEEGAAKMSAVVAEYKAITDALIQIYGE